MMGTRKQPPRNKPSSLLKPEENDIVFKLLGPRCQAQCTAVVQVFGTDGPSHNTWRKRCCGVVTFTKDNVRRSYFIQVYDVVAESRVFEQELYRNFKYSASKPFFHQFEAQDQMIGLNFANVSEAALFSQTVNDHLSAKQQKKERTKKAEQQQSTQQHVQTKSPRLPHPVPKNTVPPINLPPKDKKKSIKSKTNRSKISKDQIGMPTDFQHISHFDRDSNMELTQVDADDQLDKFFKMVGVSEQQLLDHGTRKFIYDFIERNGGVEKAMQESHHKSVPLPPPPGSVPLPPPPGSANRTSSLQNAMPTSPPPDVPSRPLHTRGNAPKSVDHPRSPLPNSSMPRYPPRAPMPLPSGEVNAGYKKSPPPPMPPLTNASVPPLPPLPPPTPPQSLPTSPGNVPRPPRPPPPGGLPPTPTSSSPSQPDARSALMNQIRAGGSPLKEVEPNERKPEEGSRGNLLKEIRGGIQLKKVTDQTTGASKNEGPPLDGMAKQLSHALLDRARVIQPDSDSSDEDDDNDEWDD
ncbi:actin nucleation-promoting factor WASL-like [Palaemon carinicauda]|uniref:actin nucleation-promoting factor WASL-like n=1 Tax=Palaemon carinicauda TaxID=392227 RepID=UPI0035B6219B